MENEKEEIDGCVMAKDPKIFDDWIKEIQQEFTKKRGFSPDKTDIKRNIVRQFKGQFIV